MQQSTVFRIAEIGLDQITMNFDFLSGAVDRAFRRAEFDLAAEAAGASEQGAISQGKGARGESSVARTGAHAFPKICITPGPEISGDVPCLLSSPNLSQAATQDSQPGISFDGGDQ